MPGSPNSIGELVKTAHTILLTPSQNTLSKTPFKSFGARSQNGPIDEGPSANTNRFPFV